jgi:WD40 repeat protein
MAKKKYSKKPRRGISTSTIEFPVGVKLLHTLNLSGENISSIAFDRKGGTLAGAGRDGKILLWEATSGAPLRTLETHQKNAVACVAFNPRGTTLTAGGFDGTAKLLEPQRGELLRTLDVRAEAVTSVAFHPAGEILATGGDDGSVRLWEVKSGKLLRRLVARSTSNVGYQ